MGTHLMELSESFPMNTNMTGFRWFSRIFASLCELDESRLSNGRVNLHLRGAVHLELNAAIMFLLKARIAIKKCCDEFWEVSLSNQVKKNGGSHAYPLTTRVSGELERSGLNARTEQEVLRKGSDHLEGDYRSGLFQGRLMPNPLPNLKRKREYNNKL